MDSQELTSFEILDLEKNLKALIREREALKRRVSELELQVERHQMELQILDDQLCDLKLSK